MKLSNFDVFFLGMMIICGFVAWLNMLLPNNPVIAFSIGVAAALKVHSIYDKIKVK